MADTHFIEVVAGRGQPPSLELRPGVELAPLSVGTGGAWQVSASGVRLVHLYVYFDGQTLFLQSAEPEDPPRVDGRPVPAAWTSVAGRCVITFGQAQLVFRPAGEDHDEAGEEPTVAAPLELPLAPAPPPPPRAPAARPFKPGAFVAGADDESTRLQPLEDFLGSSAGGGGGGDDATRVEPLMAGDALAAPVPNIRPAAGAPWSPPAQALPLASGPTVPSVHVSSGGGPPSGLLNIAPPSVRKPDAPETFGEKMGREWKTAPAFRKALIIMMPFGLVLAFWVIFAGSSPSVPAAKPGTGASAAAATASAPTTPTASTTPTTPTSPTAVTAQTAPTPPTTTGAAPPPTVPTQPAGTPPPPPVVATSAPPPPLGDASATDHRERQAADFVATHAYDQAIRIYEQLAAERPQNPAFHEAARILREKLESGKP